jgi:hypothetical protein
MRSRLEKLSFHYRATRVGQCPLLVAFSFALLVLLAPQAAQAVPSLQQEDGATPEVPMTLEEKQGCGCHSLEKESWQMSPHGALNADGQPAATCATCHGEYVEGHPDEGMIPLATDSSACTDCHEQTAQEWEGTIHAEAGIQCISCHLSHSQDLRVTSDHLCQSCHRESLKDPLHSAHWLAETSCTSCHMADGGVSHGEQSVASSDPMAMLQGTPSHDFVTASASQCLDCHSKDVTSLDGPVQTEFMVRNELMQAANQVPALRTELQNAQAVNRTLSIWQPVSLGTGIGIGGILGIAFVLVAVRLGRSKQDDEQGGQS